MYSGIYPPYSNTGVKYYSVLYSYCYMKHLIIIVLYQNHHTFYSKGFCVPTLNEDFIKIKQTKWKSNLNRRIDGFRDVIRNDNNFEKYFGEQYIEKLTIKSARLNSTIIKLMIFYSIVMVSLYASQTLEGAEFRLLGYSFKNLGSYKEFILFVAAILLPISAISSAYVKYIDALISESLVKIAPNEKIREYYKHVWVDEPWEDIFKKNIEEKRVRIHGFSVFLSISLALILAMFLMSLFLVSFFIQVVVIYDVAMNPSSPGFINTFVVIFALASILFSWLLTIIRLPMPEVDYSNYDKLSKLKKDNPEKHKVIINELAKNDNKKDAQSIILTSALAYLITFSCITFLWNSSSVEQLEEFLPKAIWGAFIVMMISNEILGGIQKITYKYFFKKYSQDTDESLVAFAKILRYLAALKYISPILLTVLYSFYLYY